MSNQKIINSMKKLVKEKGWVSFVELERLFEKYGYDFKGEYAITYKYPTLVFWIGWNMEAINLFNQVRLEADWMLDPCSPFIYYLDCQVPNLPIAKKEHQYKKDHWIPACLNVRKGEVNHAKSNVRPTL